MDEQIQAVHAAEVRSFFSALGLLADLDAGRLTCHCCGDPITEGSFRAAIRHEGRVLLACEKPACVTALAALGR